MGVHPRHPEHRDFPGKPRSGQESSGHCKGSRGVRSCGIPKAISTTKSAVGAKLIVHLKSSQQKHVDAEQAG
ncbi:hypothetical protein [Duncaniella muris]|uniref:hypothetical protein n=1 Tax=Duncaniella muris TaxID=2094150 RepID=UPI0032B205CA